MDHVTICVGHVTICVNHVTVSMSCDCVYGSYEHAQVVEETGNKTINFVYPCV